MTLYNKNKERLTQIHSGKAADGVRILAGDSFVSISRKKRTSNKKFKGLCQGGR